MDIKFKKLTKEQIIISLDRLTRFKSTKEKYIRVFSDIISAYLISPKLKKQDIVKLPPDKIRDIAAKILNDSIKELVSDCFNTECNINDKITSYENSVFQNDDYTQILLNNNIDYLRAITLINDNNNNNLRWLRHLADNGNNIHDRYKYQLKFPIATVILVEGLTEETLLPIFANYLGYDFNKEGIQVIPAGGKNQVVKLYYKLIEELKIPIFLLLDKDAEENLKQIQPRLRNIDKIHLVSCGEFEDLLPKSLIIKTVNNNLNNFASINENDLPDNITRVNSLENIYKNIGIHEFKKAEFAKQVGENITDDNDVSPEIAEIIMEISLMNMNKQNS